MKKLQLAILLTIFVIILLVVSIFSAPTFINWQNNKGIVENLISDYLGYQTNINGSLQIQILPNPKIYAEDVTIDSMSGDKSLVEIRHVIIDQNLSDLFSLNFSFDNVVINRPKINMIIDEDGIKNWEPLKLRNSNNYGKKLKKVLYSLLKYKNLSIENASINYQDVATNYQKELSNIYINTQSLGVDSLSISGKGMYNGEVHKMSSKLDLRMHNSAKLDSTISSTFYNIKLLGMLNDIYDFRRVGFIGKLNAEFEDGNKVKISKSINDELAKYLDLKRLSVNAEVSLSPTSAKIKLVDLSSNSNKLKGMIEYASNDSSKDTNIDLDIKRLNVKQKLPLFKEGTDLSDNKIDTSSLINKNINVSIKCEECIYSGRSYKQSNFKASLKNNNLIINQLRVKAENSGVFDVSASANLNIPMSFEAKVESSNFPLQTLIPNAFNGVIELSLDGKGEILTTGNSIDEMFDSVSGEFDFSALNLRLNRVNSSNLKTLADSLYHKQYRAHSVTSFGDVKVQGLIRKGVIRASDINFVLNDVNVVSKGKIDIANKSISYRLEPESLTEDNLGIVIKGKFDNLDIIYDKITPRGVVDGFGRVVTTEIMKKREIKALSTPFDFNDKENINENVIKYLFEKN